MTTKTSASAKQTRKPASQRGMLSRELIVETATLLIERDGAAKFTMRALGNELGVSAMAVYGYFPSRDDLLVAVLDRFMEGVDNAPVPGERWDDTLRRTMTSLYRNDMAHPQLASIEMDPAVCVQGLAKHTERIVTLHLNQGMPEPILVQAWALIDAFLTGFTGNALDQQATGITPGGIPLPEPSLAEDASTASGPACVSEEVAEDADAEASQQLAPWQRIVASAYTDEAFANGVELIIQGIRGLATPNPCEWRTPEA